MLETLDLAIPNSGVPVQLTMTSLGNLTMDLDPAVLSNPTECDQILRSFECDQILRSFECDQILRSFVCPSLTKLRPNADALRGRTCNGLVDGILKAMSLLEKWGKQLIQRHRSRSKR